MTDARSSRTSFIVVLAQDDGGEARSGRDSAIVVLAEDPSITPATSSRTSAQAVLAEDPSITPATSSRTSAQAVLAEDPSITPATSSRTSAQAILIEGPSDARASRASIIAILHAPPISVSVVVATETETAQTIDPIKGIIQSVGYVTETEAAQSIDLIKLITVAIGHVTEVEAPQQILATPQIIEVDEATETEVAQTIDPIKIVFVTHVAENEDPKTIGTGAGVPVGVATETEPAQVVSPVKPIFVSVVHVTETEAAQTVEYASIAVGLVAPPAVLPWLAPLPAAPEPPLLPDTHLGPPWVMGKSKYGSEDHYGGARQIVAVVGVSETEVAQVVEQGQTILVHRAQEQEVARVIFPQKIIAPAVGMVSETEVAQTINIISGQIVTVTVASEVEVAQSVNVIAPIIKQIGEGVETEIAFTVTPVSGEIVVSVGTGVEKEIAFFIDGQDQGISYNKFVIDPINSGSLDPISMTLPATVEFDSKGGTEFVNFAGWMYSLTPAKARILHDGLLDIVLDSQIVEVFYPPENMVSGYYYLRGVRFDVENLGSGLYKYDLECEKTLVSSG